MISTADFGNQPNGFHTLQFRGAGGCISDGIPDMENAWDFIRYGTISYGEAVVDSDPAVGDVSAIDYPDRTRFTVTFDLSRTNRVDLADHAMTLACMTDPWLQKSIAGA